MIRVYLTGLLIAGLACVSFADDPVKSAKQPAATDTLDRTPDPLPEGIQGFNGMIIGRLADKDVERGTFTVQVDAIARVWRNSKAEDPRSMVGKTVEISGVFGKFLDVLVTTRRGETLEFECKHDGGDQLVFPGEMLRKVEPYDPADYPILPEAFRGFRGSLVAKVIKKDPETFELIVEIKKIKETWKESRAKDPSSIEGKTMMLAGFWNRKEAYHKLKVGDVIEVGVQHIGMRSDHLTVAEFVRPASGAAPEMMKKEGGTAVNEGMAPNQRGFRGMIVGRLKEKDVERGTFTVTVDAVPRVWRNNQAKSPKSLIGEEVVAGNVTGRMLDALVVTKPGETIEFGALHDGGEQMRVGEVLRKVAPVKPGDYPVLPDAFRGFKGLLIGKVIRKDDHLLDLVVEVTDVVKAFEGSRAEDAETIIGNRLMLAGFWQRKEQFHTIAVGDTIRFGVEHPMALSDHMSVIETVEKVERN